MIRICSALDSSPHLTRVLHPGRQWDTASENRETPRGEWMRCCTDAQSPRFLHGSCRAALTEPQQRHRPCNPKDEPLPLPRIHRNLRTTFQNNEDAAGFLLLLEEHRVRRIANQGHIGLKFLQSAGCQRIKEPAHSVRSRIALVRLVNRSHVGSSLNNRNNLSSHQQCRTL